jgi:hypothetical protein
MTAVHSRRGPWAGIAVDCQAATSHQTPGFGADVAFDDHLTPGHAVANEIQPIARAFETDLLRAPRPHAERLSNINTVSRGGKIDALDLGNRFAREPIWHERREIEPLIRPLAQREHERLHGNNSFK